MAMLSGIPNAVFVLPVIYFGRNLEWTDDMVVLGQTIVGTIIASCIGLTMVVKDKIAAQPGGEEDMWVKIEAPFGIAPPPEEGEVRKGLFKKVKRREHEQKQLFELQKGLAIALVVIFAIPKFFKVNQPILLQMVFAPLQTFRHPIIQMYFFQWKLERPWNELTEEQVDKEIEREHWEKEEAEKRSAMARVAGNTDQDLSKLTEAEKDLRERYDAELSKLLKVPEKGEEVEPLIDSVVNLATEHHLSDYRTPNGDGTLLMALTRFKQIPKVTDVLKTLLENDADLLKTDRDGWNVLHWACFHGNTEVVDALMVYAKENDKMSDLLESRTKDGSTVFDIAESEGNANIMAKYKQ